MWRSQSDPPVPPPTGRWTSTASSTSLSSSPTPPVVEEEKRDRNKKSASEYRKRRKVYVLSLERSLQEANAALTEVQSTMRKLSAENSVLRHSMTMLSRLVHKKDDSRAAAATAKAEEEEADGEEVEEEGSPILVPAGFRPIAPSLQRDDSQSNASMELEEPHKGMRTRGRRSAATTVARRPPTAKKPPVALLMAVLFSCFLLYLPLLMELGGGGDSLASSFAAALAGAPLHFPASLPSSFSSSPDCSLSPAACNRGRTLLMVEDAVDDAAAAVEGWGQESTSAFRSSDCRELKVEDAVEVVVSSLSPFNSSDATAALMEDWKSDAPLFDFSHVADAAAVYSSHDSLEVSAEWTQAATTWAPPLM